MMPFLPLLACIFQLTSTAFGATAEQWRGRSIYQCGSSGIINAKES